jgi:hypothetical protein
MNETKSAMNNIPAQQENNMKTEYYEKFLRDRGWEYKNETDSKEAFSRLWKSSKGILITQDEFLAEVKVSDDAANNETLEVYNILAKACQDGKLSAIEVYQYARYRWCVNKASALISYQTEKGKREFNNCDT